MQALGDQVQLGHSLQMPAERSPQAAPCVGRAEVLKPPHALSEEAVSYDGRPERR